MTTLCLCCGVKWDKPETSNLEYHMPGCKAWANECRVAELDRYSTSLQPEPDRFWGAAK